MVLFRLSRIKLLDLNAPILPIFYSEVDPMVFNVNVLNDPNLDKVTFQLLLESLFLCLKLDLSRASYCLYKSEFLIRFIALACESLSEAVSENF